MTHCNGNSIDNRASNLAWKTHSENEADKIAHGTSNRGQNNWTSKLTEDDVREIRRLWATGNYYQRDLAVHFCITQPSVSAIVTRKKWSWLD